MFKLFTMFFALFALLAGRALAFNITLPSGMNVTQHDFLSITDQDLLTTCSSNVTAANNAINNCGDTSSCLCSVETVKLVTDAEQCFFNKIVKDNRPYPGGLIPAGEQTWLAAYGKSCGLTNMTLTLAPNWDGPFGQGLNTATTAITLIAALIVGGGAIGTLITM
ncbi:hypothetical protein BC629DRAFT_106875 [Irpex lacteus]|nr:hypothetical protein BC629DRAFT_106875 [Irpex lacteus]